MEKFNLGIPYFDQALNSLETRTLYGVHSNNAKLAQLFVAPIITNLLEHKKSVLILCDTTANILVDTYKIFNFDTQPYIESQQLVILEQPPEL
ncbi:MAG: hypothetical protein PHE19_06990, partial [Candidatus Cloacimonetes bacterium]|nr:hypothetical protein [Candidatus Cloacimonadota bacterium]